MTRSICDELLNEFRRPGKRIYREAADLLRACGFQEHQILQEQALWKHPRGIAMVVPVNRELSLIYKKLIERMLLSLRFPDGC